MSAQNGPNWYPSQQFTHTPPLPVGAPTAPATRPEGQAAAAPKPGMLSRIVNTLLRRSA